MEAIFSCKLYKGSKRKAAIRAALENPINQELVVQLKKYLDPDDLGELMKNQIEENKQEQEVEVEAPEDVVDDIPTELVEDSQTVVHVASIEHTGVADTVPASPEDLADNVTEVPAVDEDVTPEVDAQSEEVAAVESATALANVDSSSTEQLLPSLDTVKGQLNAKDSTAGVVRTRNVNDELWIYYDDKKNLNNLMGEVIESLQSSGFYNLEFNRLARTENAIVFQVSETSTVSEVNDA